MSLFSKEKPIPVLSICFLTAILMLVISCNTSNNIETEKKQSELPNVTVAKVADGEISQQISDLELGNLAAKAYNAIPGKEKVGNSFFSNVSIQGSGSNYYIIGKSKNAQGNCVSVASKLVSSPQNTVGSTAANGILELEPSDQSHSCTGNPCESCDFTHDNEGQITGCDCISNIFGLCNHTVTSSG